VLACGTQTPEDKVLEVRFEDIKVEAAAVSEVMQLVSPTRQPKQEQLSPAIQHLFSYLAETSPAELVPTSSHSLGKWRLEKIFILDDCVAVQMTEGHYLETLFFVEYSKGWRLSARIKPEDHG
jgi:hypothetical protein